MSRSKAAFVAVMLLVGAIGCAGSGDNAKPTAGGGGTPTTKPATPPAPPRIPTDFRWKGTYVVPQLGLELAFTWEGKGGDFQMIAGSDNDPIRRILPVPTPTALAQRAPACA